MTERTRRTPRLNVQFTNGYAVNWAFRVSEAYRPALDIKLLDRIDRSTKQFARIWTQGKPPAYAFTLGDVFHSQDNAITLQIQAISPDSRLQIAVYCHTDKIHQLTCEPSTLVHWLKHGLPKDTPVKTPNDPHGQAPIPFNYAANQKKAMSNLLGLCSGLAADMQLNDAEITFLNTWLLDNQDIASQWPANIISQRISHVLADGIITEEERQYLLQTLLELTGLDHDTTGSVSGNSTRLPCSEVSTIRFEGSSFCLTGKFIYGARATCQSAIEAKGGHIANTITHSTDYLIIGELASRDWANTSHGRKIEAAVKLQTSGHPIAILSESTWTKFL